MISWVVWEMSLKVSPSLLWVILCGGFCMSFAFVSICCVEVITFSNMSATNQLTGQRESKLSHHLNKIILRASLSILRLGQWLFSDFFLILFFSWNIMFPSISSLLLSILKLHQQAWVLASLVLLNNFRSWDLSYSIIMWASSSVWIFIFTYTFTWFSREPGLMKPQITQIQYV